MVSNGPSVLSLIAAAVHAAVVVLCLAAVLVAVWKQQIAKHIVWWGLAAFFAVLIFLRLTNLEEIWRDELRAMMKAEGTYEARRAVQSPLALVGVAMLALATWQWVVRKFRAAQGRRNVAVAVAQLGAFVMLGMMALRMMSFSMIDRLLYGPFKLNWIGDIGSAVLVAGCAAYYCAIVMTQRKVAKPGDPG